MASVTETAVSELCPNFHTAVQVLPSPEATPAVHLTNANSIAASINQYYSPRIQWMIENQDRYSNQSDFEIECSKVHRTSVLRPCGKGMEMEMETTTLEDMDSGCVSGYENEGEEGHENEAEDDERELDEETLKANKETIREQRGHPLWGAYFREDKDWRYVIGEKIGEGGQAKIYAGVRADKTSVDPGRHVVFKVFPPGYYLRDLVKIWQEPAFKQRPKPSYGRTAIEHVMLLPNDGRIALVMRRDWGDLRRLIDIKKQVNYNQGPPFDLKTVLKLMYGIAFQMVWLHREGVVHRDLKAANVLLRTQDFHPFPFRSNMTDIELSLPEVNEHTAVVSDYECSLGVKGTGLWRAPEVLLNAKDSSEQLFTEKSDVYSYGMLCYEIVTGFLPFEMEGFVGGGTREQRDLVINGLRPRFPDDVDCRVKDLITECWHPNEHQRPKFLEIHNAIAKYRLEQNRTRKAYLWYN